MRQLRDWITALSKRCVLESRLPLRLSLIHIFDGLLELGNSAPDILAPELEIPKAGRGVKIAVAMDEAFCFYYQDNLDLLTDMGAELVPFSPIHDDRLPGGISGLIFGGGYPELCLEAVSYTHLDVYKRQEGVPFRFGDSGK